MFYQIAGWILAAKPGTITSKEEQHINVSRAIRFIIAIDPQSGGHKGV
jgi:hypothetical protein